MTDRTIIILGFVALLVLTLGAVIASHLRRYRLATIAETVAYLTRGRPAKIIAVLIWAWLGWHFLAR
jgi:Family of unknown function (DUF6186)